MNIISSNESVREFVGNFISNLYGKYNGGIALGEKNQELVLFNTYHAQDVGYVTQVRDVDRAIELGFVPGYEKHLWNDFRERNGRRDYIIGKDEQDYARKLIDKFDDVRVGDYSLITKDPHGEEEPGKLDFDDQANLSDEQLLADAEAEANAWAAGRVNRLTGYDFRGEEKLQQIREEVDIARRHTPLGLSLQGQTAEDFAWDIKDAWENVTEKRMKQIPMVRRLLASAKRNLKTAQADGRQSLVKYIKGKILELSFELRTLQTEMRRASSVAEGVERMIREQQRGGFDEQNYLYGMQERNWLDHGWSDMHNSRDTLSLALTEDDEELGHWQDDSDISKEGNGRAELDRLIEQYGHDAIDNPNDRFMLE